MKFSCPIRRISKEISQNLFELFSDRSWSKKQRQVVSGNANSTDDFTVRHSEGRTVLSTVEYVQRDNPVSKNIPWLNRWTVVQKDNPPGQPWNNFRKLAKLPIENPSS
ncbi:hypothetical protein HAX54_048298 [Datura stramonium]|uniref:Uncharacterized protein n=1 Tax=Datura stramonium TaxID=4076 RepID=A0ABS8SU92_DATST|nr:hypothetical protein [Datura stramonium]